MSKFKVGDKVKFVKSRVNSFGIPDNWTKYVDEDKVYTVDKVTEGGRAIMLKDDGFGFLYSPGWLDKVEEGKCEVKFKVGDKVYVRRGVSTGVPQRYIDYDRAYTIIKKWPSGSFALDGELSDFGFAENWLLPAKCEVKVSEGRIKDVKFSGPATIVFWTDGTKTVVKCRKGDKFDPEKGIAMACAKKLLGNEDGYHKEIAKYAKTVEKEDKTPDEMRMELKSYCHGKWCSSDCVIAQHRNDTRCVCGMGYGFTTDKNSSAYIKDEDIRVFYKWLKEGLKNG